MDELFYCNCGNKGPDGAECPRCHSYFAFESHKSISSGLANLSSILIGVFLGIVVGVLIFLLVGSGYGVGILSLASPFIGGVLGNKAYKSLARKSRQNI